MTSDEKNKYAGIFLMANGGILELLYVLIALIFVAISLNDGMPPLAIFMISSFMLLFTSIFCLPQIIGGWKMYKKAPNSRIWGWVASVLALMNFPIGTAAGVFAIIFLTSSEGIEFYETIDRQHLSSVRTNENWQNGEKLGEREPFNQGSSPHEQSRDPYNWK